MREWGVRVYGCRCEGVHSDSSSRYLWKIYLEKERFDLAKLYSGAEPDRINVILRREAEHSFKVCCSTSF